MRQWVCVVTALGLVGCSSAPPPPPPPPPAPQVFLTVSAGTIIGAKITGTTSVSGCKSVTQVQLLTGDTFIADANYKTNPTNWEIAGSLLNRFYSEKGLALTLSLTAKVLCDDNRTNTSQPVSVTFFPVASVFSTGQQTLPDAFVAEGGLGASNPTTFVGCIGTATGRAIARVDTQGQIIVGNNTLPFDCTYSSQITDKNPARGTRWLMEPNVGAFAFDSQMNITAVVTGEIGAIGIGSDGDAILWDQATGNEMIERATSAPAPSTSPIIWTAQFPGIMNADPLVDVGTRNVFASSWQYQQGVGTGNVVMIEFNYDTGVILNADSTGHVPVLISQDFGNINQPITPYGSFNNDGSLLYLPLIGFDASQNARSAIIACASRAPGCIGAARRWTSATFDTLLTNASPFSNGNYVAGVGPNEVYFLSASDGTIKNLGMQSLRPDGSLFVHAVQAGAGSDFYILTGPASSTAVPTYPIEVIATDAPERGELWRLETGTGDSPLSGMYLAVDEGGQVWLRIGPDQVKPLKNSEYRMARGATPLP